MEKVIEVAQLQKSYPLPKPAANGSKEFQAIKGTSFFVERGEIFGILGPNGAGKTTTLEIIEGLKRQSSGTVTVLGIDNLQHPEEIKKRIGVQLQSSEYLPFLTLHELLDLFASIYGQTAPVKKLLALVNLTEKEHSQVKNLSGGQKQRFTIATSLVNQPEILFLDEPTTGLDPAARHSLWDLIKQINATGITIVLTTHYMEEAEFLCHRVAIMDKGTILKIDAPRKLIEQLSDTVQVAFFTEKNIDAALLQSLPGIKNIHNEHPKVLLEVESLERVSGIVYLLKKEGISFSGFTVKTASLEDVYLQLTGKEYEGG